MTFFNNFHFSILYKKDIFRNGLVKKIEKFKKFPRDFQRFMKRWLIRDWMSEEKDVDLLLVNQHTHTYTHIHTHTYTHTHTHTHTSNSSRILFSFKFVKQIGLTHSNKIS